jgi:hypothetical protein
MSMRAVSGWLLVIGLTLGMTGTGARAQTKGQDQQHVVSLDELTRDTARPGETRRADEASVRDLLSSEVAQEALRSAKVDYHKVDQAIAELSDEDLARVAARSRQAQGDFAAGGIKSTLIVAIVLIVVLIVVLRVVF